MALAACVKIPRLLVENERLIIMFLHKHRTYSIENRRRFCTCEPMKPCPTGACKEKRKKPFWKSLFSKKEKEEEFKHDDPPPIECCKVRYFSEEKEDPDLTCFGGTAYKTCGNAYVIQKDMLPEVVEEVSKEDLEVRRIETHPDLKEFLEDPLPKFESVPMRLVEISNRRLHPLYDKYRNTPRQPSPIGKRCPSYKTISGPIDLHDVPLNIGFNKKLLEKKNLYSEYKRVEPPREILGRLIEMKKNSKPLLEYSRPERQVEPRRPVYREKMVYDTLNQDKKQDKKQ